MKRHITCHRGEWQEAIKKLFHIHSPLNGCREGTDDFRNLIPLCKACNRVKGSRLMTVEECCKYLDKEFIDDISKYSK